MFNKRLKERVNALEIWVENISSIQNQLLKELGYNTIYEPRKYKLKLYKIEKEKENNKLQPIVGYVSGDTLVVPCPTCGASCTRTRNYNLQKESEKCKQK